MKTTFKTTADKAPFLRIYADAIALGEGFTIGSDADNPNHYSGILGEQVHRVTRANDIAVYVGRDGAMAGAITGVGRDPSGRPTAVYLGGPRIPADAMTRHAAGNPPAHLTALHLACSGSTPEIRELAGMLFNKIMGRPARKG